MMNLRNLGGGSQDDGSDDANSSSRGQSFAQGLSGYSSALSGRPQEKHEESHELHKLREQNDALQRSLAGSGSNAQMSPALASWASNPGFGAPANGAARNANNGNGAPQPTQVNQASGYTQQPVVTNPQVTTPGAATTAQQPSNPFVFSRSAPDLSALDEAYRRLSNGG